MSNKDIRSFFFGGKPVAAQPAPAASKTVIGAKGANKKNEKIDEDLLVDSDDDGHLAQRKRLKTTKQAATSSPGRKRQIDEDVEVVSPSTRKSTRIKAQSPERENDKMIASSPIGKVVEIIDSPVAPIPVLPVLGSRIVASPVKIVREVKGGASSFFGNGPSLPAASSAATATAVAKSPATGGASAKSDEPAVKSPPSAVTKSRVTATTTVSASPSTPAGAATAMALEKSRGSSGLCFEGQKVAVTGVMEGAASREEIESLVLQHGGKLSAAVSGKTTFLVAGRLLEDGRASSESSKYRTAAEKKVPIISDSEFLDRIAAHQAKNEGEEARAESQSSALVSPRSGTTTQASNSASSSAVATSSSSSSKSGGTRSMFGTTDSAKTSKQQQPSAAEQLWVDKYRPQSSAQMIGSTELVSKLTKWLQRWDAVHLHKTEKVSFSKENPGARAVLLSGPPGIGKSTVAALAAKEGGYDVMELNASDTRNRKEIEAQLSSAVTCMAISSSGEVANRKRLVVMDEVDGMGGSDRGGIAELIKVIKTSKVPIICICNDRQSTKIRSLANHCFDLKVRRPTKQQIASRLVAVAKGEGMLLEQNAAEMLVEQVGNDIRQALNSMQMWRASSASMNYTDVKAGMNRIEKDKVLRLTPFDACGSILGGNKTSFDERYNSFFIDYSLTPLLVQQNYVDSAKGGIFRNPALDDVARMEQLSRASDAVSDIDLAAAAIRGQNMHWELLTTQAVFTVRAGAFVQGFQAFPGFPAWLGKNSSQNKMSRLTKEIVHHTALSIGQGFQPIRLDYVPYLRQSLLGAMRQLQAGEVEVGAVVEALDAYGLTKEDFSENMRELQMVVEGDKQLIDHFAGLDSKVKASLTKAYNSTSHRSQVLVSELTTKAKKGTGRGRGGEEDDEEALLGEEALEERVLLAADDEEKEDDEDISALIAKKSSAAKGKKAGAGGGAAKGKGKATKTGK